MSEDIQITDRYIKIIIEVGVTLVMGVVITKIGFIYVGCLFSLIDLDCFRINRCWD